MRFPVIIGIDEAGRGPLAGPVAVGAALVPAAFDWRDVPGVGDSKQTTRKVREAVFARAHELRRAGALDFQVALVGPGIIDDAGIVGAVSRAMARSLSALRRRHGFAPAEVRVLLDGSLRAPSQFANQTTIIRGDASEKCIGLASILAKVARDRHMERLSAKFPEYGFDRHMGYGTKAHCDVIKLHGLSEMHRRTFCRNLMV